LGARFNAPINVLNALSTEIISAVRGLKEIIRNQYKKDYIHFNPI